MITTFMREIPKPVCPDCGGEATVEVIVERPGLSVKRVGVFCLPDGQKRHDDWRRRAARINAGLPDLEEQRGLAVGPL